MTSYDLISHHDDVILSPPHPLGSDARAQHLEWACAPAHPHRPPCAGRCHCPGRCHCAPPANGAVDPWAVNRCAVRAGRRHRRRELTVPRPAGSHAAGRRSHANREPRRRRVHAWPTAFITTSPHPLVSFNHNITAPPAPATKVVMKTYNHVDVRGPRTHVADRFHHNLTIPQYHRACLLLQPRSGGV
jgi:hypothetical protein